MRKPKLQRISEPDTGLIHYQGCELIGNATLCGITDFLNDEEQGKPTRKSVTCDSCMAVKRYCDQHAKQREEE